MLQTTAMPDGDDFIINGTKMFPTFADVADFVNFRALARDEGSRGSDLLFNRYGTPGYRVVRSIATIAGPNLASRFSRTAACRKRRCSAK